jgi:hypothetical protein
MRLICLGFAKIKGEWGIVVRDEIVSSEENVHNECLLKREDQDMLIQAIRFVPSLLQRILRKLTDTSERLECRLSQMELALDVEKFTLEKGNKQGKKPKPRSGRKTRKKRKGKDTAT